MNFEYLGNLGEFFASLGVMITLVYLAVQTRSNTRVMRAQARSSITDQILQLNIFLAENQMYREAVRKSQSGEALSDEDRDVLLREASMWFRHMENVQYQYSQGLYEANEYHAQRAIWVYRFNNHPFWREAWKRQRAMGVVSPNLVAEIEPIVKNAEVANESSDA